MLGKISSSHNKYYIFFFSTNDNKYTMMRIESRGYITKTLDLWILIYATKCIISIFFNYFSNVF